jgi:hypothetical protein
MGVWDQEVDAGLEPESWHRRHWRDVFNATGSSTSSGGGSAAGTGTTKPEGFRGTKANVLVHNAAAQLKGGHLRVQSSDACIFLEIRRLSWIALAPTKSSPPGARGHTGTDGAFVEGLVALELHNER